ncbi:MAG TPA: MFS transporter [Vicinamibacterales bacterium]|nr:MFS transporter [Vicinamibacterales bacterium]
MFDFANSSYTTVIVTVVFSVVFPRLVVGDGPEYRYGNLLWSVALSVSYALVVLTAPLLGAIMDFRAAKKRFLFGSYALTVVATAMLYFVTPGRAPLGVALVVLSNYGFSVGESFTSSFLPELGPVDELGKISGYAWGLGYIGGVVCTALVIGIVGEQTAANFERVRLVGPVTALFFLVAAIPTFLFLRERGTPKALPPGESLVGAGMRRLRETGRALREFRDLLVFFAAYFFAMAGLSIVIAFAFIYGDQVIGWSPSSLMLMFVITNLTASAGSVGFGFLQKWWGNLRTFNLTLVIWIASVAGIWGTPSIAAWMHRAFGVSWSAEHLFLAVGAVAGLCLGATQSASRTIVAVFSPSSKSAEFFGFWGLFGKLASVAGLLSIGALQARFGLRTAILVCSLFFLGALLATVFVREARGRAAAAAFDLGSDPGFRGQIP